MLNIDQLKYDFYKDIADFVIRLCNNSESRCSKTDLIRMFHLKNNWMYTTHYGRYIWKFSWDKIIIPTAKYINLSTTKTETLLLKNKQIQSFFECLI